ncbi:MAG: sodium-dependent transporter [Gemmatimonadaceae bacterium]
MTGAARETFTSRLGVRMTMLGVAVGIGNVWRFPYLVGKFGGSAFVLFYVVLVVLIGIPALMAEWVLGRHTRRGTLGAFARTRLPFGKQVGWLLFLVVIAATGYYTSVIGWVALYGVSELARLIGVRFDPSGILPPESGFSARSLLLQMICTAGVTLVCAIVLIKGLRRGIERVSIVLIPTLLVVLLLLIVRALTLPGAWAGVQWYLLKFRPQDFTARVAVAALGHTMFTLSLGGTFMVVYGSYLNERDALRSASLWTAVGDTASGLLAGLAIFPAVFALGLEPSSGPALIFATLPKVFAQMPAGAFFGFLFFIGLFGAGYLSDVASFEVVIAGLTDNTTLTRTRAVWITAALVFVAAIPPMINMRIFVPWDLTFGSGMQTLGALLSVITVAWSLDRATALRELSDGDASPPGWMPWLYGWLRFVVPSAIVFVGVWWLLTDVLKLTSGV